jgi:hypothetical protein
LERVKIGKRPLTGLGVEYSEGLGRIPAYCEVYVERKLLKPSSESGGVGYEETVGSIEPDIVRYSSGEMLYESRDGYQRDFGAWRLIMMPNTPH